MKQEYFVVVLAHSLVGRLRRIHVPHQAVYITLALALIGCFRCLASLPATRAWRGKWPTINNLRREADQLRARYRNLQKVVSQTNEQLASLEVFAKEAKSPTHQAEAGRAVRYFGGRQTRARTPRADDYNYLRTANTLALGSRGPAASDAPAAPQACGPWMDVPALGVRRAHGSAFRVKAPFHTGVDISAVLGPPVRAAADGSGPSAERESGYGRGLQVDHGTGIDLLRALSRFYVQAGQDVRRGEMIGASTPGCVDRAAPALRSAVRHAPVNPYRYLAKSAVFLQAGTKEPFYKF